MSGGDAEQLDHNREMEIRLQAASVLDDVLAIINGDRQQGCAERKSLVAVATIVRQIAIRELIPITKKR